ncbi:sensor histidine kinase [Ideonella sp. BN130291]|uniref:sensor histidine kinase n=1 Tax=Ideonella sp. BN130291 TaxID=3112940 RepID=UPI002E26F6AE|nr:ATP-binding protein [Ideonella sp. BN130291]
MDSKRLQLLRRAVPLLSALALLALMALAAALAFDWSERREFARLADAAAHQLDLYAAVLDVELGKQADLPALIDADGEIATLLAAPDAAAQRDTVNRRLTRFVARAGALSASVVDSRGRVVASSDWFRPDTQVDHLLANEPCVGEALAGEESRRFAPDPASGAPEVCFARPLSRNGATLGAVLVRISLEPIEATWVDSAFRPESEKPLVVDAQGMVIMSSVPAWKLQPLASLTVPQRALAHGGELVRMRQSAADVPGLRVVHERPLARFGWRLLVLSSAGDVWRDARAAAWSAAAAVACLGLVAMVLWQRRRVVAQKLAARAALQRANEELEAKVRQRTAELEASNAELRHEVLERQHAEQVLRQAQEELVQAGKLALLGQLSAGISHELGQPLTALRALAENGRLLLERGRPQQAGQNFEFITGLAERMGRITSQLKSFARKAPATSRSLPLREAIANAQQLLATRLRSERVSLQVDVAEDLEVECDGHRLEQVLVNLMANAADAMRASEQRRLTITAAASGERVVVRVADSGPGIPPALNERLFEPFFTTKPPGEGLGLGLVISSHIVREFGGQLRSVPTSSGAVFEFDVARGEPCLTDSRSR